MKNNEYFAQKTHGYMFCNDGVFSEHIFSLIRQIIPDDLRMYTQAFEIGAGMGRFSFALVKNFPRVWLIEPSEPYAATMGQLFVHEGNDAAGGPVTVINSTFEDFFANTTIPENSIFFCFHLLHHLRPQQRQVLFNCIARTAAPAVFVEPNPWNPLILIQLMLYKDMRLKDEMQYITFSKRKLSREFAGCGLRLVNHDRLCFLPPPVTMAALRLPLLLTPLLFCERFRHIFPLLGSYQLFYCKREQGGSAA
jgi:hypothetical protein